MSESNIIKSSVSQQTNAQGCMRRWWGRSVQHWPQPQSKATIFGDILHAVADRFHNATDQGLDPNTGQMMNLYPPGWHRMKKRWDKSNTMYEINVVEQAQIQFLIASAIEKGILLREPGRIAEMPFTTSLTVPGFEAYTVQVTGFKDLVLPDGVFDLKTAKNTKYCLSVKTLQEDMQMMFYGLDHLLRYPGLEVIRLGHKQFIKDRQNPRVQERVAKVSASNVWEYYNKVVLPLLHDMLTYRLRFPKGQGSSWSSVPQAKDSKECNFYYGGKCPYLNICTGVCSPEKYVADFKTIANRNKPQLGDSSMSSLLSTIQVEQGRQIPPSPAPAQMPQPQQPQPQPQPQYQPQPQPQAPTQPQAQYQPQPQAQYPPQMPPAQMPQPQPQKPQPQAQVPGPGIGQPPAQMPPQNMPQPQPSNSTPQAPAPAQIPANLVQQQPQAGPTLPTAPQAANSAPWFSTDCEVCRSNGLGGFREDGQPCQICQIKTNMAAQAVAPKPDGSVEYSQPNQTGPSGPSFQSPPLPPAQTSVKENPTPQPPAQTFTGPPAQMPTQIQAPAPSGHDVDYTLLMGCSIMAKALQVSIYDAQDMFNEVKDQIKAQSGQDIETLDHFKSLPIIDTMIPGAIAGKSNCFIQAHTAVKGSLYHRFVDGLRSNASIVIVAIAD